MSRSHFLRSALGVSLALAAGCMSMPALADTPVAVTFAPNSVWAQEIGNLTHENNSGSYTVAVAAGKTLQLNLLSRNPNVHFKVKDQTQGKQVLDSRKTGESSWTTVNTAATTYLIQVYIETAAIGSDETTKYALQVGQYGAEDMQSPTTAITFDAGKPWAERGGVLAAGATSYNFSVAIATGMTIKVNLVSSNPQLHFRVTDASQNKKLVDTATAAATTTATADATATATAATSSANTWTESPAAATNYVIQVYADPAALPAGQQARFALQVGQYSSAAAQPAGAASAMAPAASATAPGISTP